MKRCTRCNTELPDDARFCLRCGAPQEDDTIVQAHMEGSGAVAEGGAKAAGERGIAADQVHGPVITGDDSTILYDAERIRIEKARVRYLKRLRQRCNILPLAALGGEQRVGQEVTLEQVYVGLDTRSAVPLTETEKKKQQEKLGHSKGPDERRLSAMEAATENRRLTLLGDPGSGKSAFVRRVAAYLASVQLGEADPFPQWEEDLLPLLVILRELGPRLVALDLADLSEPEQNRQLLAAMRQHWQEVLARNYDAEAWAPCLDDLLTSGNLLVIFDGVDEVAPRCRKWVRRAVLALLRSYPAIERVIVTSRIRSYTEEAAIPGFVRRTLAPFDRDKIVDFVEGWYEAQTALGRLTRSQARRRIGDLWDAVLSGDLRELASNPMLLTCMAIIHQREVRLPKERVCLYSLAAQVLLNRWQKHKGIRVSQPLADLLADDLRLHSILEQLAYLAQAQAGGSKGTAVLERKDLLVLLEQPKFLGDVGLVAEFLDYIDQRAGLLVGQGGGVGQLPQVYSFPHRTFQEYLAGCYIVGRRGTEREYWARAKEGDKWYLAAQLGAEELLYNRRSESDVLDLAYALSPKATLAEEGEWHEHQWRATSWSGYIAALLGKTRIRRDQGGPDSGEDYLTRLITRLVRGMRQAPLDPVERAEAGNVLAELGDPRFREDAWYLPDEPLLGFVEIPGGPFLMGTDAEEREALDRLFPEFYPYSYDSEMPRREIELPTYYISRYPVTVAQYQAFVRDGGYRKSNYWREARQFRIWRRGAIYATNERTPRSEPYSYPWLPNTLSNHPVVGVTWFEMLAYTRWLTEKLRGRTEAPSVIAELLHEEGWTVALPSDAEWEKAASWNGERQRRYPWGPYPDANRANFRDTGIDSSSPVGCFPGGASPYGIEEMSGNVWEFTRTMNGYGLSKALEDIIEDAADPQTRALMLSPRLKGGAAHWGAPVVRCAMTLYNPASQSYPTGGFRTVLVPRYALVEACGLEVSHDER
ncbi:MAG: SUMF1/EgtB/PvdO family nonheme iron enzyme [bacterium]